MRKPDYDRRVVVTGLGVISPVGNDVPTAWANLVKGESGLGQITRFDPRPYEAKLAGEVHDFDAADWMDPRPPAAASRACTSASPRPSRRSPTRASSSTDENRTEVGVVFGSGAGGQPLMIDNYVSLKERGPRTRRADVHRQRPRRQLLGDDRDRDRARSATTSCIVSACATGTHNVGEAAEAIRRGDCIAVISGSTEAPLLEVGHAGFSNMRGHGHAPRPGEAAPDRLAAVRPDARRVRPRRGRRARCSSRTSSSPRRAARRSTPRSSATARPPTAGT